METRATPNAEHIEVWNDIVGPKWIRHQDVLTRNLVGHSDAALALHPLSPGQHVLEVGCGLGDLAVQLARMVGPGGRVVACDCAERFLAIARQRPEVAALPQLTYSQVDAQTHAFDDGAFDVVWSRFGTMFFASAVAALRNLRGALRPGGTLVMQTWRRLDANEWMQRPKEIALRHLPAPEEGPTCGPGPFSMADPETVAQQLRAAGYERVAFEPVDAPIVFDTIEQAVQLAFDLGPAGELVRLAGDEGAARRPALAAELAEWLGGYTTERGVEVGTASWCVTARRPLAEAGDASSLA